MFEFAEAEGFHEWWEVDAEASTEAFLQAVPAADWIAGRTAPSFDGTFFGWLLFVGAAEIDPVAGGFEHGVEIFDTSCVIVEDGFAYDADEDLLAVLLVCVHGVV